MTTDVTVQERVLVVEDDRGMRDLLVEELQDAALEVNAVATLEQAMPLLGGWQPDLVVSDLRLPDGDGMVLLRHAQRAHVSPAFLIITAFGSIQQAVAALKEGADEFLTKPLDLEHFVLAVKRVLENRRLRSEVQRFRELMHEEHFHGMFGRSQVMRELFEQIRMLARANGSVLIVGESGTGKELVAKAVHAESERAQGPFLAVNCAGIPAELLEAEFFGHQAGAFTGASRNRKGLFQQAHTGTLFLDEIGEMPPALQAKLLRVLQEGRVRPVGAEQEHDVDVRIIAATNRDLDAAVDRQEFREDLFFRLETFTLRVPPLREREDDIELLAARFLAQFGSRVGRGAQRLSDETLFRLREYPFPGNVRELANAMERAATFCGGGRVGLEHLPSRIAKWQASMPATAPAVDALIGRLHTGPLLPSLEELERRYIAYVLDSVGGNKRRAAALLGIGRRTLYRRLGQPTSEE